MQIRAVLGTIAAVGGLIGTAYTVLGKKEAGLAIKDCAGSLSPESLEICKGAFKEAAKASKELYGEAKELIGFGLLMAGGAITNLFANALGKSDEKAKKELEQKLLVKNLASRKLP